MPTDTPTAEDVAFAVRWSNEQNPTVFVQNIGQGVCVLRQVPRWLKIQGDTYFDSNDAAWSALASALTPIRRSLEPVIREEMRSEIDRLTAENARLRAAQEWRPISEAPKDRTEIIGARIKHGKVWAIAQIQFNGLAWYESHSGDGFNTPTHWMPLTAPPTEAEKGIGGK